MRAGVLGGTFDPVHLAHLIIAEAARVQLSLAQVIFMPAGQPWLKANQPQASREDRYHMVQLAVASNPYFRVASNEIQRDGYSYSVDTLRELRDELGPEAEIYFILGQDRLHEFHQWKQPNQLLKLCSLAVVDRPGYRDFDVPTFISRFPAAAGKLVSLAVPLIDISATDIRRRAASARSIRYMVPEAVEQYISQRKLYWDNAGNN